MRISPTLPPQLHYSDHADSEWQDLQPAHGWSETHISGRVGHGEA
jgi:hypothetical protein